MSSAILLPTMVAAEVFKKPPPPPPLFLRSSLDLLPPLPCPPSYLVLSTFGSTTVDNSLDHVVCVFVATTPRNRHAIVVTNGSFLMDPFPPRLHVLSFPFPMGKPSLSTGIDPSFWGDIPPPPLSTLPFLFFFLFFHCKGGSGAPFVSTTDPIHSSHVDTPVPWMTHEAKGSTRKGERGKKKKRDPVVGSTSDAWMKAEANPKRKQVRNDKDEPWRVEGIPQMCRWKDGTNIHPTDT